MKSKIIELVKAGLQAPSGDNCHPWKFLIKANEIVLVNIPEKDDSLYAYEQHPSLISHGAAICNIRLKAKKLGLIATVQYFPNEENPNVIARIVLTDGLTEQNNLSDFIYERITNRHPYESRMIDENLLEDIKNITRNEGISVSIETRNDKINTLEQIASKNEYLVLTNKYLHKFLFSHVRWASNDLKKNPEGLFIKTLEMKAPQEFAFKIASNWIILKVLNKIGFAKFVASENAKVYTQSAAFIAFSVARSKPLEYIKVGETLQLIWLHLTKNNISGHPLTGIIFLNQQVRNGAKDKFTNDQIDLITKEYDKLENIFNLNEKEIAFMLRIGHAPKSSAVSPRRKPDEVIEWI